MHTDNETWNSGKSSNKDISVFANNKTVAVYTIEESFQY